MSAFLCRIQYCISCFCVHLSCPLSFLAELILLLNMILRSTYQGRNSKWVVRCRICYTTYVPTSNIACIVHKFTGVGRWQNTRTTMKVVVFFFVCVTGMLCYSFTLVHVLLFCSMPPLLLLLRARHLPLSECFISRRHLRWSIPARSSLDAPLLVVVL